MGVGRLRQAGEEGWKGGGREETCSDEKWGRQYQQQSSHLLGRKSSPWLRVSPWPLGLSAAPGLGLEPTLLLSGRVGAEWQVLVP